MRQLLAPVRIRVTVLATLAVVVLLLAASLGILALVERNLLSASEQALAASIDEFRRSQPEPGMPDNALFRFETPDGPVFVGVLPQGDRILAPIIDPVSGEELGELVIDAETGEVIEVGEGGISGDPGVLLPEDLTESIIELVPAAGGQEQLVAAAPLTSVRDSVGALRQTLLMVIPGLAVLLALMIWWIVGMAFRPVDEIRRRAHEINANTLAERVPVPPTRDEVAQLAEVINEMLDRIESGVERRHQFVADASHELRSPLGRVRRLAEAGAQSSQPGQCEAAVAQIVTEAEHMDELVEALLTLARLDQGELPDTQECDLSVLVESAVQRSQDGIRTKAHIEPRVTVLGSRRGLEVMLVNVMDNAFDHARARVTVSLTTGTTPTEDEEAVTWAHLAVDDDGEGIEPRDRGRVFERFTRLSAGGDGVGLGLAIVRAVVAQHGGEVSVRDSPIGGARFVISLPVRGPAPAGRATRPKLSAPVPPSP